MRHQWYRFVRCVLPAEKLKSRPGGQDSDYYSEYNARRFHSIKTYLIWLILSKNSLLKIQENQFLIVEIFRSDKNFRISNSSILLKIRFL